VDTNGAGCGGFGFALATAVECFPGAGALLGAAGETFADGAADFGGAGLATVAWPFGFFWAWGFFTSQEGGWASAGLDWAETVWTDKKQKKRKQMPQKRALLPEETATSGMSS
jgi:hypothetical protein